MRAVADHVVDPLPDRPGHFLHRRLPLLGSKRADKSPTNPPTNSRNPHSGSALSKGGQIDSPDFSGLSCIRNASETLNDFLNRRSGGRIPQGVFWKPKLGGDLNSENRERRSPDEDVLEDLANARSPPGVGNQFLPPGDIRRPPDAAISLPTGKWRIATSWLVQRYGKQDAHSLPGAPTGCNRQAMTHADSRRQFIITMNISTSASSSAKKAPRGSTEPFISGASGTVLGIADLERRDTARSVEPECLACPTG